MKFKLDENLPAGAARVLADAGHDVSTALQEQLVGKPDSQIAETCKQEQRALITLDNDFVILCLLGAFGGSIRKSIGVHRRSSAADPEVRRERFLYR
jgi:predicted nuclease of predicted toxin-antitoxin system